MPVDKPSSVSATELATPYSSSDEEVSDEVVSDSKPPLAERSSRLMAAILDGIFTIIPCGLLLSIVSNIRGITPEELVQGSTLETFVQKLGVVAVWALINFYNLRRGQTIGKRIMKIQVVDVATGNIPSLGNLILLRFGLFAVISQAGVSGFAVAIANLLMIFGEDRRCMHDYLARTKVIKVRDKR